MAQISHQTYLSLHHVGSIVAHLHYVAINVDDVTCPDELHKVVYGDECPGTPDPSASKTHKQVLLYIKTKMNYCFFKASLQ